MVPGEARHYERALLEIEEGKKVSSRDYPSHIVARLLATLEKKYQAGATTYEPQTLFELARHGDHDRKYLGDSSLHILNTSLFNDARYLRDIAVSKERDLTPARVLGLNPVRQPVAGEPAILISGIPALREAMTSIRERESSPGIHRTPLIIQNTGHIWEDIFRTNSKDWPVRRRKLERLNVYLTSGPSETADLLADMPGAEKIPPRKLDISVAVEQGFTGRHVIFATGDKIKFSQTATAQKELTPRGSTRFASDIFGPSGATPEQTYSFIANALEKAVAQKDYIGRIGAERSMSLLRRHRYESDEDVLLAFNDGGLAFCLETADGQRRYDIFTPDKFPDTYHKLNPLQSGPGVELAYMKRTGGLANIMNKVWERVDEIVKEDPRFTANDLVAYDTCVYMALPLKRVLNAARDERPLDYKESGMASAASVQKLRVVRTPICPAGTNPETEDYLIPPGKDKPRSYYPDWIATGPNAEAFRLLQQVVGSDFSGDSHDLKRQTKYRAGMVAVPEMLHRSRSEQMANLKRVLERDWNVSTQQGPDVWRRYHAVPGDRKRMSDQVSHGPSVTAFDDNMVRLLDDADILYVGDAPAGSTELELAERRLLIERALERNQLFNWIHVIAKESAIPDILLTIRHKQAMGLVPQKLPDILTLVQDEKEAARQIAGIARNGLNWTTPVERKFTSGGAIENRDCMQVVTYFSATNVAKSLQQNAERLGYLLSVNGFSMKFGGGDDGLMKAAALGFLAGKKELRDKGYDFPNQLISIQCVDTEAIEKPLAIPEDMPAEDVVMRCHSAIEPRIADLQNTGPYGGHVAGAGGVGTDDEIGSEITSRLKRLLDPATHPFIFYNMQLDTAAGLVGANDPYRKIQTAEQQERLNMGWAMTPEEIVTRLHVFRDSQPDTHLLPASQLQKSLRGVASGLTDVMNHAVYATRHNGFRPSFTIYTGEQGGLAPSRRNERQIELKIA